MQRQTKELQIVLENGQNKIQQKLKVGTKYYFSNTHQNPVELNPGDIVDISSVFKRIILSHNLLKK